MRPRILFVGTLPPHPGGTGMVSGLLLPGLSAAGFAIDAVAPGTAADTTNDAFALAHPEIAVHRITMPFHMNDPYRGSMADYVARQQTLSLLVIERIVAVDPPDLFLIGRELSMGGVPEVARRLGIPCVLIAHGIMQAILNGSAAVEIGDEILATIAEADLVVAVSRAMGRLLRRKGFRRVAAIPNGVDTALFTPGPASPALRRQLGLPVDAVVCGHVSNMKPIKGPLDLVAAAAVAASSDPRLHWLIVGDGDQRGPMQRAVAAAGLEGRFRFVGWAGRAQVAAYMRLIDMLVMPSRSEGTPLACLEAMATGCVPLLSDIPAHREVTVRGRAGLLFRVGDADHLAGQLLRLAADPLLRARLRAAAIARVQEAYRWETALERYVRLLGRIGRGARAAR